MPGVCSAWRREASGLPDCGLQVPEGDKRDGERLQGMGQDRGNGFKLTEG